MTEMIDVDSLDERDEWCVFYGGPDPDNAAGVHVTEDQADAEEMAEWFRESGVACRTIYVAPWEVQPTCSSCGSVLDGNDCCDGRLAEIAAGEDQ